jgi:DNA topoisomerase III
MQTLVIAEKPSVARDIARVLGANQRQEGFLSGNNYCVTWAIGHLVTLPQPHEINPSWKAWRPDLLPMLPTDWPLVVIDATKKQFGIIQKLMGAKDTRNIICATDAGREGELIFRYIYEKANCKKPVRRLWISSLTPEAILQGFNTLQDSSRYEALAAAARGRSQADWLVGMNLSRAYTLAFNDTFSVGRVQTPTLAIITDRTQAIANFIVTDYLEVVAHFELPAGGYDGVYIVRDKNGRLHSNGEEAGAIAARARAGVAHVGSITKETKRKPPPLLYDLTELQRHANRLYGFTAGRTLEIAQSLYEQYKLLSYPRTDSRHITSDVAETLCAMVDVIKKPYLDKLAPGTGIRPLGKRFVDDSKVSDHHAIIPTTMHNTALPGRSDEAKIYDLVCRRLLAAWHDDHISSTTTVLTHIDSPSENNPAHPIIDTYRSKGTLVDQAGWHVLDAPIHYNRERELGDDGDEQKFPTGLSQGQRPLVQNVKIVKKQTKPPSPFTDATLLTAMETAGNTLEDKELTDAMRSHGLGTPATRATIIETLLTREYIIRKGKALFATSKGIRLIQNVHEQVKSPAMTGQWEYRLKNIERGNDRLDVFMKDIESYVRSVVGEVKMVPSQAPSNSQNVVSDSHKPLETVPLRRQKLPISANDLDELLHRSFGFEQFRPYQKNVCAAVTQGKDVVLVMPTGAGKSLCYQLPGIARAGTTLVISPLIALMEDQVASLKLRGFSAERIHSGRSREESRGACRDYLGGNLDFLFIAPERLAVPGFPEMLSKRKPTLIAVDEAHCISQWGHDFRPDYRMLKNRLPLLLPAPIIALTATATPRVQNDIAEQLGIAHAQRFIHGFRRANIAIEVVELGPAQRSDAAKRILEDDSRRPAIVYAPTRKKAEELAGDFSHEFSSSAYHAGMSAQQREKVQTQFLANKLDVIVATIAFGMGIDKPNVRTVIHAALPGSVESYYQEIGRAGRDGKPSRAILMYSWADCHTHEFFHKRNYPELQVLERLFNKLTAEKQPKDLLRRQIRLNEDVFDTCLEKLWVHGGAVVDPEENVSRGIEDWKQPYQEQSVHKLDLLDDIKSFAGSRQCRMLKLVAHFGDQEDSGEPCGQCDICVPTQSLTLHTRPANAQELQHITRIVALLNQSNGQPKGKIFREEFEAVIKRNEFELFIDALCRAQLIQVSDDSFVKQGKSIQFQRLHLTPAGVRAAQNPSELAPLISVSEAPEQKRKVRKTKRPGASSKRTRKIPAEATTAAAQTQLSSRLVSDLKSWRLGKARKQRIPAFRILTDRTLYAIAEQCPKSQEALLMVSGVGPAIIKKYGLDIIDLCKGS